MHTYIYICSYIHRYSYIYISMYISAYIHKHVHEPYRCCHIATSGPMHVPCGTWNLWGPGLGGEERGRLDRREEADVQGPGPQTPNHLFYPGWAPQKPWGSKYMNGSSYFEA